MIKPLKHDLLFIIRDISKFPKLSLHDKRNFEFLLTVKALHSISFMFCKVTTNCFRSMRLYDLLRLSQEIAWKSLHYYWTSEL